MAFPIANSLLVERLRAAHVALADDSEYAKRLVMPTGLSSSPPITFEIARNVQRAVRHAPKHKRPTRRKPQLFVDEDQPQVDDLNDPVPGEIDSEAPKLLLGLRHTKTIRKNNPIAKLFQARHDDSDSESGGSIRTMEDRPPERNLALIEEEGLNDDVVTIDSDFGVPVTATGSVGPPNGDLELVDEEKDAANTTASTANDTYEYGTSGDEDDENFEEDASSTDLAFTDIEGESILDLSMILDPDSYSFGNTADNVAGFQSEKKKKKKLLRSNSSTAFEMQLTQPSKSLQSIFSSAFQASSASAAPNNPTRSHSQTAVRPVPLLSARRPSFTFEKRDVVQSAGELTLHLSNLIQLRSKSSNANPLNYFSYVNSALAFPDTQRAHVSVFLPPSRTPAITELPINNQVAVSDCIGYILLSMFKEDILLKPDRRNLNPNYWRLELVDEDGENYGSFGKLDRSRLLSSYNNPKEIALCKVDNDLEFARNEQQTPLPQEFRASLDAYINPEQYKLLIKDDTSPAEETVAVKIANVPTITYPTEFVTFFIGVNATVGELLDQFCILQNLSAAKYCFKPLALVDVDRHRDQLLLGNLGGSFRSQPDSNNSVLDLQTLVVNLESNMLVLVPAASNLKAIKPGSGGDSTFNAGITPTESAYSMPFITPPKKQLEERFQPLPYETNPEGSGVGSVKTAGLVPSKSALVKTTINANKYLDDMISGKNPLLPTNLYNIYFKWRVWRKKPPLLNIEKLLIIDGDYIHLTPTDDNNWKKNTSDLSNFTYNNQQHHHHHHLHHSNYYNNTVMKTSSFHITQILRFKLYKNSKSPGHFKIVITKPGENDASKKEKKYHLEAQLEAECEEIIQKIKWVLQVYSGSSLA